MKRPLQRPGRGIVLALLGILAASASPVRAQLFDGGGLFNRKTEAPRAQTEDEIGVPVPVTGRVEALKGHEVQFEIRAESKTPGATVEFLIRAFPSAGKIVSLVSKPHDRNKAIVVYWADPNSGATRDAFSFAVRYRGGRYSSEMRYDIDLVDLKAEIQVPATVDFGEVAVGGEAAVNVTVRNLGNGPMERQIFLAPPWHLLDPADGKLNLGPRGARVLKIAFRPEAPGETSYFLSFSRHKTGTAKLVGVGSDPFRIATETVELALDERSGERRGEIELVNEGNKAVAVEARASTRLQSSLLEGYLLAPGKSTKVPVHLGATDTAPFDGSVEFSLTNGYAKSARVIAAVVPARLEVSVPNSLSAELLNFGRVEAGHSEERAITVTNRGGVGVPLEFHVPEPFRLLTNPGPQLAPLAAVDLSIALMPTASRRGVVDVTMNVMGDGRTIPIRLLGNVVAPAGGSAPASTAPNLPPKGFRLGAAAPSAATPEPSAAAPSSEAAGSAPASSLPTPLGPVTDPVASGDWQDGLSVGERDEHRSVHGIVSRPIVSRKVDPALRRPEDLTVLKSGSHFLEIGWTAPKETEHARFDIEMRGLLVNAETGAPESVWAPYPGVEIERIDRLAKARISKLNPASRYDIRVVLTTEDGRSSRPSEPILATTDLPMDWTYIYAVLGLLFLAALGFAIRRIILDRRPEVYQSQYVDL